jgi:hypothetical protein
MGTEWEEGEKVEGEEEEEDGTLREWRRRSWEARAMAAGDRAGWDWWRSQTDRTREGNAKSKEAACHETEEE